MAMNPNPDRNTNYMREVWGTSSLITDYWSLEAPAQSCEGSHYSHGHGFFKGRMLREINNDDMTPKKHDFSVQKEIHEKIRNDNDYDDWEYGTEPIFG
jgi:ribulose kinase